MVVSTYGALDWYIVMNPKVCLTDAGRVSAQSHGFEHMNILYTRTRVYTSANLFSVLGFSLIFIISYSEYRFSFILQ